MRQPTRDGKSVGYRQHNMSISPTRAPFANHSMWVALSDGRAIGVPLASFSRLLYATPAQRAPDLPAALQSRSQPGQTSLRQA